MAGGNPDVTVHHITEWRLIAWLKRKRRGIGWRGIVREAHPVPPWEWSGGFLHSIGQHTICQVSLRAKRISYSSDPSTNPAVCA